MSVNMMFYLQSLQSLTPIPIIIISWALMGVLYAFLAIKMLLIYQKEQLRTTLLFAVFFVLMSLGGALGLSMTLSLLGEELIPILFLSQTIAISALLVAALDMAGYFRWWPAPALFAGLILVITLLTLLDPALDATLGRTRGMFIIIVSLPVIALFLWVFWKVRSGKALAFALGILIMALGMGVVRIPDIGPIIMGSTTIISVLTVFVGLMGWIDKYILKNPEE